jgi:nucleotide sugar dehydrogenase
MNTVGVIGIGKLGLCMALVMEKAGYKVICHDRNEHLARAISDKTLETIEPQVTTLLKQSKHLVVVQSIRELYTLPIVFVVVATPSVPNGSYNHTAEDEVVESILNLNKASPNYDEKVLVISCTTMPMYCDSIQNKLAKYNYKVCYNPEFIAQGDIVHGLKNPDMVLIGGTNTEACNTLVSVYKTFLENTPVFQTMTCTEAEITKISLNCFLTTKIAFANMIGDIVLKAGGDQSVVLKAIGSDTRVGGKFLKWGHGFGGPCLPRDNRALSYFSNSIHINHAIGETTDQSNKKHLSYLFDFIVSKNTNNKPVYFSSVVYKKNTYMLEESQTLELALLCQNRGLQVILHDSLPVLKELETKYGNAFTYVEQLVGNESTLYFDVNSYIN